MTVDTLTSKPAKKSKKLPKTKLAKTKATKQKKKNKSFKTIDLFAGIGGLRLGFEMTGAFETVFANDIEQSCKYTYDLNFPGSELYIKDLKEIHEDDVPDFDFLLAGFPCQAFSVAGYREGFNDSKGRGDLFFEIARLIEAKSPEGFLLENVKNLEGHDNGRTFKVIQQTLSDLGYTIKYKVLNTKDYSDLPQNRERVYIVGFKNYAHAFSFEFPNKVEKKIEVKHVLEKLRNVEEKYFYEKTRLYDRIKDDVVEENVAYQWRRQYVRKNQSGVFPTLTANMGTGGHNVPIVIQDGKIRKITPRECARIQGFPEGYLLPPNLADSKLYQQFGNSVSVSVINRIAEEILKVLKDCNS